MKIFLCFYRDKNGEVRLFHSYDETEAKQAAMMRCEPQSLVKALLDLPKGCGSWAMVMIDTDEKILATPPDVDRYPLDEQQRMMMLLTNTMEPIDFDKLLPS